MFVTTVREESWKKVRRDNEGQGVICLSRRLPHVLQQKGALAALVISKPLCEQWGKLTGLQVRQGYAQERKGDI